MARLFFNRPKGKTNAGELAALERWIQLPDDWSAVQGVLYDDPKLGPLSREADFILLSPTGHLLLVEVKGGDLGHLADTGEWATYDRDNPYWQLLGEHKGLLTRLRETAGDKRLPFIAKALLFPHCVVSRAAEKLPGDIPRHMVMDRVDLENFPAWWENYLRQLPEPERANYGHSREYAETLFLKTFAPGATPEGRREFAHLTDAWFDHAIESRFPLLDAVADNPRLLVRGAAGTGKTLLAVEHALRLAESGKRVLFLVFNLPFESALDRLFARFRAAGRPHSGDIILRRLQSYAHEVTGVSGEGDEFWEKTLPAAALTFARDFPASRQFDAVVVDEAQDIATHLPALPAAPAGWWPFVLSTVPPEAPGALFYDPTQPPTVDNRPTFSPEAVMRLVPDAVKLRLPLTHRHTLAIGNYLRRIAQNLPEDLRPELASPETAPLGLPVTERYTETAAAPAAAVALACEWLNRGLCDPADILFIGLHTPPDPAFLSELRAAGIPYADYSRLAPDAATYLGIHRAKGVESRAVILYGIHADASAEIARLLFAGASRARQLLGVIRTGRAPASPR